MGKSPFRPESPVMRAVGRVGDLVLLNLLFVFCSIPVVTIGASAAALYTSAFRIVRREDGKPAKTFFSAFANNFRQSLVLTIVFLALFAGLYANVRVTQANPDAFPFLLRAFANIFAVVVLFTASYAFALQAKFVNTLWGTLKNAFVLSMAHPFTSIAVCALTFFPLGLLLFATYYFLLTSIVFFLFWFSCSAVVCAYLFECIFRKILPPAASGGEGASRAPNDS